MAAIGRLLKLATVEEELMEDIGQLDETMAWHCDHMAYEPQRASHFGKDLVSGVSHVLPETKGMLPLASRAVRSWEEMEGEAEREPLCLALSGVVVEELGKKKSEYGWACFVIYGD